MIPTLKAIQMGRYRFMNGEWHKLCSGPAHDEPEWLPATGKYYYRRSNGKFISRCRLCNQWKKLKSPGSHHGYIPVRDVRPFYIEAVNRIGLAELCRRTGVSGTHVSNVLNLHTQYAQKSTARRVMLEYVSIQRKNEYSINGWAKVKRDARNVRGLETCNGCGTPVENVTAHCNACRDRHYRRYKSGQITEEQWAGLKAISDISKSKVEY